MSDRGDHGDGDAAESRARLLLKAALVATIAGLALAGTADRSAGGVIVVAGWLVLVYALHSFGRAGSNR